MGLQWQLLNNIKSRHLKFLSHVIRAESIESLSLQDTAEAKDLKTDNEAPYA